MIIDFNKVKSKATLATNIDFYDKLELPPQITEWLRTQPNTTFRVFADPKTGLFAGIIREDMMQKDQ